MYSFIAEIAIFL